MNKFDEREKSFEKKFAKDAELQFKVAARSNKYLAEFVISKLGKLETDKQAYTQEIIKADMEESGNEDVFRKIKKDFQEASVLIEDSEIRDQIEKYIENNTDFKIGDDTEHAVRIDKFSDSSIDLYVRCFTKTNEWGEWLKVKERLAVEVKKIVESNGASFAFPSTSIYVEKN